MMIRFLIEKEFKLIARNKFLPRLIIIMPVVMMIILPFAADSEVRNINLSVVDADRTTVSAQLVEKISSSEYFDLVEYSSSYNAALDGVESGQTDIILEIPENFARDLVDKLAPNIHVSANAVNATKAAMGSNYINSILQSFVVETMPLAIEPPQITVETQNRFNPMLNYKFFMVPALMVMLLTVMCSFLPAVNIVGEKESGTIEQMNVTPVGRITFILSKVIPYLIIGFLVLTISFGVAYLLYGLVPVGSVLTIYAGAFLFILTILGLGLLVSNFSSTLQQSMFVMFFFLIIMLLLSGLLTPVESMPSWAQNITVCNPLTYFIRIMRGVYLKGSTIADIDDELYVLAGFAVFINTWAVTSYHKRA